MKRLITAVLTSLMLTGVAAGTASAATVIDPFSPILTTPRVAGWPDDGPTN